MGLPEINVAFKSKSMNAIERSAMGIVALILRDETSNYLDTRINIKSIDDVKVTDWTTDNYDYIRMALLGTPSQIVILRIGSEDLITDTLKKLGSIKFNYVAIPSATVEESTTLTTWIKSKRAEDKKTFKAVVANQQADNKSIINFTTGGIKVGEKEYTAQQFTTRIAGILAGLPFTRSSTYYVLPEVDEIIEHENPNADIDAGQLILINDGEKIKIGRGVNSLTTVTTEMKEDWKKIKIVEVMDMITDDIRDTFNDHYVGKLPNITDNQILYIISVKTYFKGLAAENILDNKYENTAEIDVETQRLAWQSIGTDTNAWDDTKVREMSFGSSIFLAGNVKIVDAVEDLDFNIFSA